MFSSYANKFPCASDRCTETAVWMASLFLRPSWFFASVQNCPNFCVWHSTDFDSAYRNHVEVTKKLFIYAKTWSNDIWPGLLVVSASCTRLHYCLPLRVSSQKERGIKSIPKMGFYRISKTTISKTTMGSALSSRVTLKSSGGDPLWREKIDIIRQRYSPSALEKQITNLRLY